MSSLPPVTTIGIRLHIKRCRAPQNVAAVDRILSSGVLLLPLPPPAGLIDEVVVVALSPFIALRLVAHIIYVSQSWRFIKIQQQYYYISMMMLRALKDKS